MPIDVTKAAKWRMRAEQYRVCAASCISPGAQLAYRALAQCADDIASRFDEAAFNPAKAPDRPAPDHPQKKCG
jgi:hypothetical protein